VAPARSSSTATVASADAGQVIRLAPANAAAWSGRCWSRAIVGQLDQALSDCNEALRLEPSANTLERRALVYLKSGQFGKAIADYDCALKTNPKRAGLLYGRGMAKLRGGDAAGGNADMAAAKEIDPRVADAFAGYNVPALRAEATPPAVEAPSTSEAKPEVAAAPPANQGADAAPPAPPAAAEITTSVSRPVRSDTARSMPSDAAAPAATAAATAPAADCSFAETHWKSAESIGTLAVYEDHLARFPTCAFSTLAAARIEALRNR
jgi:tetratricopeptide (TPR) repeat protein